MLNFFLLFQESPGYRVCRVETDIRMRAVTQLWDTIIRNYPKPHFFGSCVDHKPVARALLETVESLDSRTIQYIKPLTLVNSDSCVCVCVQERETKKGLVCVRVCT